MKSEDRPPTIYHAARELGALAAEVADFDWRHPAWLALVAGTALFEAAARAVGPRTTNGELYATYLSANGGPRTDTFMARASGRKREDPAEVIAAAVQSARVATAAVATLAAELPDQPLLRVLAWEDGWLTRAPLPDGSARVAFVTPRGAWLADLAAGDEALAAALGAACAGRPETAPLVAVDATARTPTPAAIAIALAPEPIAVARHLHRRAWTAAGGPWLGIGRTGELDLVTTCHLVVDGFGHGRVASLVFAAPTDPPAALVAAARRSLGPASSFDSLPPLRDAQPIGFAATVLDGGPVVFPRVAYAFGRAIERIFRGHLEPAARRAARFSPTFQVPLVPGDRSDADRRRRRLLFGLLALRMEDGRFEGFEEFRARLEALLPREAAAEGLLSRVLFATSNAPLPSAWRRRLLASRGEPHPLLPPVEVLAGRGQLSLIRFDDGEAPPGPLYAASAPALVDALGGCVLTLIPSAGLCAASVCGTGRAGTPTGANDVLEIFAGELATLR